VSSSAELERALAAGPVTTYGVGPGLAPYLAARLAPGPGAPPLVVVVAEPEQASALADDVRAYLGPIGDDDGDEPDRLDHVVTLATPDASALAEVALEAEVVAERLATLYRLAEPTLWPRVVVTSVAALMRRTVPAGPLVARALALTVGAEVARADLIDRLVAGGWARTPMVEGPGTFAVRGGVLDLFAPLAAHPVRLELDGDRIDTMRWFDLETQRTIRPAGRVLLHPVRETIATGAAGPAGVRARLRERADEALVPTKAARRLIEQLETGELTIGLEALTPAFHDHMEAAAAYVPAGATWMVLDREAVARAAQDGWGEAERELADRDRAGKLSFPLAEYLVTPDGLAAALAAPTRRVVCASLEVVGDDLAGASVRFDGTATSALRRELDVARAHGGDDPVGPLDRHLHQLLTAGTTVVVACDGQSRYDRVDGILTGRGLAPRPGRLADTLAARAPGGAGAILVSHDAASASFVCETDRVAVLAAADLFGARPATRRAGARKRARDALLGAVDDFAQLAVGDYLVHQLHGVGRYLGLRRLPYGAERLELDCLHLEYDGGTLYLPVFRTGEVQRYVGADGHAPRLDKLGGLTWAKTRSKVSVAVAALAEELLQLYAQRAALPGHRFPSAGDDFREFEARFPFQETPDQLAAIDAVLADMEAPRAMDRIVCGDVGYGKTEVALRAIFRAATGGKQAVLLAPTTVLVEQHARTLAERFAGFPILVGKLSRFQDKAEQAEVVRRAAAGQVDVVVGTHRLLSADVRFRDLGLVVIDEEQRFGVAHKERLKKLRASVDVLTLTATPIPRTLHLAMTGLRDLSIIATPPTDRRAVRTMAARADDAVVRSALEHELARGGQVFFITPTIERIGPDDDDRSIAEWAAYLRELVPTARVGVAHGQLPETELERVMVAFVGGELDVLCATAIVESGLDIPRANTMLVAHAERFGLAQLYQIRGRVGRSRDRAYCYLLVPPPERLTPEARRRLEVLQRFTELGAGFHIASHDLEIRGGGELLGARQSGSIAAVGFDTYVRMLERAVAELRGSPIHDPVDPELTVDRPGYIPDDYVPDPPQRLELYKRLSSMADPAEADELLTEIADRFGPLPGAVLLLAELMSLKAVARGLGVQALELSAARLALGLLPTSPLGDVVTRPAALAAARADGWRLLPDGRLARALSVDEARTAVPSARRALLALAATGAAPAPAPAAPPALPRPPRRGT
jgi:transcription-repair coupling factor (superfamily II helicase)